VTAGERIKALRRHRGWTQDQLAQATGVSRSAVAQWETGRAGFGAKARLIATALEVSLRQLHSGPVVAPVPSDAEQVPVTGDEAALLRHFRELESDDQACVIHLATRLASLVAQGRDLR
jgi:transcriptional regulator with XRE-family HTH domain